MWDRSRAVGQAYVDFAFAEPAAYGLIFAYTQPHEDAYPELAAANARSRRTMVAYVEDLVRAGQLEGDPELLGHVYWAAMHGAVVLQMSGKLAADGPGFDAIRRGGPADHQGPSQDHASASPLTRAPPDRSLADLVADLVFLLVQGLLFLPGDVAMVLAGHVRSLPADLAVFLVQLGGLGMGELAVSHFLMDALVLVLQTLIHLGAVGVVCSMCPPCRRREAGAGALVAQRTSGCRHPSGWPRSGGAENGSWWTR
jgi:hypothetical protein